MGISLIFVGYPPPRLAYRRIHSHDFFRFFFLVSKNKARWLPNGSPGDPQIHKKHEIGSSGRGPEKSVELNSKLEALDLRNLCFYIGRGYKNHSFHPSPKTSRNGSQIVIKTIPKAIKSRSGGLLENTTKTNAENNAIWTIDPGGGPTNVVFAPQCASGRAGGARWAPRPPPRAPKTTPNYDFN